MIAERPITTSEDFRPLFDEQRRRYLAEPNPSLESRLAKLEALGRAIAKYRGEVVEALARDFGKSPAETEFTEIVGTLAELKFARKNLASWMKPRAVSTPLTLLGARSEIRYEPKGNVLILSPWNYPFYLSIPPLIAAIAAGNRVFLRPSEKAPYIREVIGKIVADAFAPDDVAFAAGEVDTAEALLQLPFNHIFFTGSTRVGKHVMRAAAENLAGVTLELGGKSPAIIAPDADAAHAAQRIVWGKFMNNGQTCVAPDYVLVHESIEAPFLNAAKKQVEKMYGPSEEARAKTPDLARLVDVAAFDRLSTMLDESAAQGAQFVVGGPRDRAQRYIAPAILTNVEYDSPLMREEIFGPILPVIGYRTLEEALAFVNSRPKPLALYAFGREHETTERIVNATTAGGSAINDCVLHLVNPNLPFGGIGDSGVGSYHGEFGFRALSHERAVLHQGRLNLVPMLYPPYSKKTMRSIRMLEKL